jgi:ATP-dependent Lon protease
MELPKRLPVMLLSEAVLFPQALLPIYVFEHRYQEMLADTLDSHRMFLIGLTQKKQVKGGGLEDVPHPIVGVGLVRVAVGRPDGTTNLILQGLCRARVTKLIEEKSYCEARIIPIETIDKAKGVEVDALAAKVAELIEERNRLGSPVPKEVIQFLVSLSDADILSDLVSFNLLRDIDQKQEILETVELGKRLRRLIRFLQDEISHLKLLQQLKDGDPDKIGLN